MWERSSFFLIVHSKLRSLFRGRIEVADPPKTGSYWAPAQISKHWIQFGIQSGTKLVWTASHILSVRPQINLTFNVTYYFRIRFKRKHNFKWKYFFYIFILLCPIYTAHVNYGDILMGLKTIRVHRLNGWCGPLHQVEVVFGEGQWPPITNFLCDPGIWPQWEAECEIAAFYLNF